MLTHTHCRLANCTLANSTVPSGHMYRTRERSPSSVPRSSVTVSRGRFSVHFFVRHLCYGTFNFSIYSHHLCIHVIHTSMECHQMLHVECIYWTFATKFSLIHSSSQSNQTCCSSLAISKVFKVVCEVFAKACYCDLRSEV